MGMSKTLDRPTGDEYLEEEQSFSAEELRSGQEGGNIAELTELAASPPARRIETGDDLEDAEAATNTNDRFNADNHLAEIAAPSSVIHNGYAKDGQPEENLQTESGSSTSPRQTRLLVELSSISWIIFFSFLGTLARLGVETISIYPYQTVSSTVLWANLGGSLLMGFLLEDRRLFQYSVEKRHTSSDKDEHLRQIDKNKKTLPVYIGLTTGFCGIFTSFSTFMVDAMLALSNRMTPADPSSPFHEIDLHSLKARSGGSSFLALSAVLIIHPTVSIGALKTGAHIAVGMERLTPSVPIHWLRQYLDPCMMVIASVCWLVVIILVVWPVHLKWRFDASMPLVFAPVGALLRFYLSKYLNARIPRFPLGTFLANVFGTCIAGMCYDIQHSKLINRHGGSESLISCAVLEGIIQGFCGCTTTVSTWVVELNALHRHHAWQYGLASVTTSLVSLIAIMGTVIWTGEGNYMCS